MRKAIGIMATVAILAMVGSASAAVVTQSWTFDNPANPTDSSQWSTQGWTTVLGSRGDSIVGVLDNPDANDGTITWGGGIYNTKGLDEPSDRSGTLYAANGSAGYMAVPNVNQFVFQADLIMRAGNVNKLFKHGMAWRYTYDKDTTTPNTLVGGSDGNRAVNAWFEGRSPTSERMIFGDTHTGASTTLLTWLKAAAPTDVTDYNIVETARATIYYNWDGTQDGSAGQSGRIIITWEYLDYTGKTGNAATTFDAGAVHVNTALGVAEPISLIRLGADQSGGAWSQFQADNVTFKYIPEPAALTLLALGLPMLRRRR